MQRILASARAAFFLAAGATPALIGSSVVTVAQSSWHPYEPSPAQQSRTQTSWHTYEQEPASAPQLRSFFQSGWSVPPPLSYNAPAPAYAPSQYGDAAHPMVDPKFDRQLVDYKTDQPPGTIIVDTAHYFLYLVMKGGGKAIRYGIGVGREGFTWTGENQITAMREWPEWRPPNEMLKRRPDLPRFVAGGPDNPLGARALYLGSTLYRIHGSNEPWSIGSNVSSGCIRLRNADIVDLYGRVKVGTKVVVL
jgi:lipoprotein-anchoring transpeptidase ErfK/SrfK